MEYSWNIYGISMEHLWNIHGTSMNIHAMYCGHTFSVLLMNLGYV
jgi:hypothetical protein